MHHTLRPATAPAVARIDLQHRTVQRENLPDEVLRQVLGGRGLCAFLLWRSGAIDAHDPQMPIVICPGALAGTDAPSAARVSIATRSPQSGAILSETGGGALACALRFAEIIALEITGCSPSPCVIRIEDADITFIDPTESMMDTTDGFAEAFAGFSTICAGPAARCGVPFASLIIDRNFGAWRGGAGAAFAHKNLVGIAVKGTLPPATDNVQKMKQTRADIARLVAASPALTGTFGFSRLGTTTLLDLLNARHMLPTGNFRATHFEPARRINAASLNQSRQVHAEACSGCEIACRRIADNGRALPVYESLAGFTALLNNADLEAAIAADTICRQRGMDPVSCAARLAAAAERQKIRLSPDEIVARVEQISCGITAAIDTKNESMTIKNMDMPPYDPRGSTGLALALATATRGACHLEAWPVATEILRKPVATDRFSFSGKARMQKMSEDRNAAGDALGVCRFLFLGATLAELARAYSAATGQDISVPALLETGARICYLERMINHRFGVSPSSDTLPERFFNQPGTPGPDFNIPPIDRDEFVAARNRYYRVRGLDDAGCPHADEAERLKIPWTR